MREKRIGGIHAMCLSIGPWRDPALTIRGRSGVVSNETANTTDREQCRCDERLAHRSGRLLTSGLSEQFNKSHALPLFSEIDDAYVIKVQPFVELGNLLVPHE